MLGEDRGKLLPPHAILEGERAHHRVYLALVHTCEKLSVLREHRLGEQDVAHEQLDLPLGPERGWFVVRELLGKQLLQRCHDVPDTCVSTTPGVDAEARLLLQNGSNTLDPRRIWGGVLDSLQADILVRPEGPAHAVAVVDLQLIAKEPVAHPVCLFVSQVDGPELADPQGYVVLEHVRAALQESPLQNIPVNVLTALDTGVGAAVYKAWQRVVVVGIDDAGPRLTEHVEIHRIAVALEEDQVVRIYVQDRLVEPPVEGHDELLARVGWLVYRVITSHPRVAPVALGYVLPDVHGPVLEVPVTPEQRLVGRVVRVPVLVLVAWQGVQVDYRVDSMRRAQVYYPIQVPEAIFLYLEGPHVVLEVPVVHGEPEQVQPKGGDESRVTLREEVLEEAVEEDFVPLLPKHFANGLAHALLVRRVACYEVLHVHPAAEAEAAQHDRVSLAVHNAIAPRPKQSRAVSHAYLLPSRAYEERLTLYRALGDPLDKAPLHDQENDHDWHRAQERTGHDRPVLLAVRADKRWEPQRDGEHPVLSQHHERPDVVVPRSGKEKYR